MSARASLTVDLDADRLIDAALATQGAMSVLEVTGWGVVRQLRETSPKESGRLSRSWSVRAARDERARPIVYVGTRVPYWHLPQFGSVEQTPQRYVDKAMSRTGLPYRPNGKAS